LKYLKIYHQIEGDILFKYCEKEFEQITSLQEKIGIIASKQVTNNENKQALQICLQVISLTWNQSKTIEKFIDIT